MFFTKKRDGLLLKQIKEIAMGPIIQIHRFRIIIGLLEQQLL